MIQLQAMTVKDCEKSWTAHQFTSACECRRSQTVSSRFNDGIQSCHGDWWHGRVLFRCQQRWHCLSLAEATQRGGCERKKVLHCHVSCCEKEKIPFEKNVTQILVKFKMWLWLHFCRTLRSCVGALPSRGQLKSKNEKHEMLPTNILEIHVLESESLLWFLVVNLPGPHGSCNAHHLSTPQVVQSLGTRETPGDQWSAQSSAGAETSLLRLLGCLLVPSSAGFN